MSLWKIFLALFLILYGLLLISNFRFDGQNFILAGTAIVAAILLLFDK